MISVPFADVDGGNVPTSALQFTNVVRGDGPQECDFLQIWDGNGGFKTFYCYSEDGIWYRNTAAEPTLEDEYPDGIPAGAAMWYLAWVSETREGAPSFTVSGAIPTDADITFTLNSTSTKTADVYNMLSNPYPASWLVGDGEQYLCEIKNVVRGDGPQECDFLQIWDGNGGFKTFYCYSEDGIWYRNTAAEPTLEDEFPNGIPAGTPAWYLAWVSSGRGGDLTIKFKNPIK